MTDLLGNALGPVFALVAHALAARESTTDGQAAAASSGSAAPQQ